jgi:brefeldin A-inhibited guanine nucleotide-exchange protein
MKHPPKWWQSATAAAAGSDHLAKITEDGSNSELEDDPQTREPVHRAITITMEAYAMVLGHDAKTNKGCELAMDGMHMLVSKQYFSGRAGGKDDSSGSGSKAAAAAKKDGTELPPASLMHRLVESIAKTSESNVDIVQTAVVRTLRAIMTSPKCGVHESTMLLALRSTFHVYLVTKTPACKQLAKEALLDTLRSVFFRMEAYDVMARGQARKIADAVSDTNSKSADEPAVRWRTQRQPRPQKWKVRLSSQYHTDSYVLLGYCARCVPRAPVDVGGRIHGRP